ncbi:MAG TPA: dihydroorotate dehydrogenase, partial [Candidatus Eisenbacteria bacterium]|nr:dihydroorotate dehydrogenase [Candidatus Eisenbacteria bacterium]
MNLETSVGGLRLKNPVLVASGTFGHAKEFEKFIDLRRLGGIVTKTITLKPRLGNPPQRIVETPSGMLNAIGLQNPGVDKFIEEKLPYLRKIGIPIVVSAMGYTVDDLRQVVKTLEKAGGIDGYELNLSCPNVSYAGGSADTAVKMFAHDAGLIESAVGAVRKVTKKTVIAKLGPDVSDIGKMARAAEKAGADAVSLINTFVAMAIDVRTRRPVLANKTGGLSGPCVRPIAVRMTWDAARAVKIPVVGIGGIMNAHDALEFLIAGASAVQVGTANFMNPAASIEILDGLK